MRWSVRAVYYYLVSFVMLMTVVFGSVTLVNNVIRMFEPDYARYYPKVVSPQNELAVREELRRSFPAASEEDITRWTQDRLRVQQEEQALNYRQQMYYRWSSLVQSAVLIVVALPVYLYHWRRAQRLTAEGL
jgi:hypothetical protein